MDVRTHTLWISDGYEEYQWAGYIYEGKQRVGGFSERIIRWDYYPLGSLFDETVIHWKGFSEWLIFL